MKKTNLFIKLTALVLAVCLTAVLFAGCGSSKTVVMSLEKDGKTYTITEDEFSLLMRIRKRIIFCNLLYTTSRDTTGFWQGKSDEEPEKTNEQYYKEIVMDQIKAILVEKYLSDSLGVSVSQNTLDGYKSSIKTAEKNYGGKGAYKQYFGYTAATYYNVYEQMVNKSEALLEHLCKEGGLLEVKDADLEAYYLENYVGYQYIVLDMKNKVVRDENGNRVLNKKKDEDGKEVDGDTYKTEEMTKEEKEAKEPLPESILAALKDGTKTFEQLIAEYSDVYYSVEFPEGQFVHKDGTFINTTVNGKVKDLEIGQHTAEAIKSGDYLYIVKRVDLKEKVYDDDKYSEFFTDYKDAVEYEKYEEYVETFFDDITVVTEITDSEKYSMEKTFLSAYVDEYYRNILYYYGFGS